MRWLVEKWLLLCICTTVLSAQEKTVLLTPPVITDSTILTKVACNRPSRQETPNLSVSCNETDEKRWLINCYGLGGSGWTVLFGAVNKAVTLFEQEVCECCIQKPIRVVGSGCVGLLCAIELAHRGYKVAGISTKEIYDISSYRAGAYFSIGHKLLNEEGKQLINDCALEAASVYQQIAQGDHPFISSTRAQLVPLYAKGATGVELLEEKGLVPAPIPVRLDFGKGIEAGNGWEEHWTYRIETAGIMADLRQEVERLQIPIRIEEVTDTEALDETIVFNCTGLGARELVQDNQMVALRGYLIVLNENAFDGPMPYILSGGGGFHTCPKALYADSENPSGLPSVGVIGGATVQVPKEMSEEELQAIDEVKFEELLQSATKFFNAHTYQGGSKTTFSLNPQGELFVSITTDRLYIRSVQPTEEDYERYAALFGDKEVMEKLVAGAVRTRESICERINQVWVKRWKANNPASGLAVFKKGAGEFLGHISMDDENPQELEISYLFHKQHWGKGYAKEAVNAVVKGYIPSMMKEGYFNAPLERIVGTARPDNPASCRILEGVGMQLISTEEKYGALRNCYSMNIAG